MVDWIIESREITGGTGESPHYTTEAGFLAALKDLFGNPKKKFVSATLPDGKVIDEAAAKALAGFAIGGGAIGETPIG